MPSLIEKQHTCNGCGCEFRYAIDPRDWKTPWMSQSMKPEGSVRCYPCPDCGLYQPEMVMWQKVALPLSIIAAFPLIMAIVALGFANGGANAVLASQIGTGVLAVYALFQIGTVLHNPNADLKTNRPRRSSCSRGRLLLGASKSEIVGGRSPASGDAHEEKAVPQGRIKDGHELLGMGNATPPVVGDFDRSKWGNRGLR